MMGEEQFSSLGAYGVPKNYCEQGVGRKLGMAAKLEFIKSWVY